MNFTLSVRLHRGVWREDGTDDQQQAGMPGRGGIVFLQCLFDTYNPRFSWSPSSFEAYCPGVVYLESQLVDVLACQMSKVLDYLLLHVVLGWCCSDHFPDVLASHHVSSGLVGGSSWTSHLAGGDRPFNALFRVHIWHWYVGVGMKMELMSLALLSMGKLGCLRNGASW